MPTSILTPADQRRLEKLARDAGRTSAQTLRFVLRDGFEFCEWEVRESLVADADASRKGAVPNEEVQRRARSLIDSAHAQRRKQAA